MLQRGLQGHEPLPGKPGTLAQQVDQLIQLGLQKQLGAVNVPVQAGKLAEEQLALPGQRSRGHNGGKLTQPCGLPGFIQRQKLDAQVGNDSGTVGQVDVWVDGIVHLQGEAAAPGRIENVALPGMEHRAAIQPQGKGAAAFLRQKEQQRVLRPGGFQIAVMAPVGPKLGHGAYKMQAQSVKIFRKRHGLLPPG